MARKRVVRKRVRKAVPNRRRTSRLMAHRKNATFGGKVKTADEVFKDARKVDDGDTEYAKGKRPQPKSVFPTKKKLSLQDARASFNLGRQMGEAMLEGFPQLFTESAEGKTWGTWAHTIRKTQEYKDVLKKYTELIKTQDHWFAAAMKTKSGSNLTQEMISNAYMRDGLLSAWQQKFVDQGGSFKSSAKKKKTAAKKTTKKEAQKVKIEVPSVTRKKPVKKKTPPAQSKAKEKEVGCLDEDKISELSDKIDELADLRDRIMDEITKSNPALRRAGSSRYSKGLRYAPWMTQYKNPTERMDVPKRMKATPRSAATSLYASVSGKKKSFPIGDLYHARKAVNYVFGFPNLQSDMKKVAQAVMEAYPEYYWGKYWRSKISAYNLKMRKAGKKPKRIPSWADLLKKTAAQKRVAKKGAAKKRLVAANPRRRKNAWMLI